MTGAYTVCTFLWHNWWLLDRVLFKVTFLVWFCSVASLENFPEKLIHFREFQKPSWQYFPGKFPYGFILHNYLRFHFPCQLILSLASIVISNLLVVHFTSLILRINISVRRRIPLVNMMTARNCNCSTIEQWFLCIVMCILGHWDCSRVAVLIWHMTQWYCIVTTDVFDALLLVLPVHQPCCW